MILKCRSVCESRQPCYLLEPRVSGERIDPRESLVTGLELVWLLLCLSEARLFEGEMFQVVRSVASDGPTTNVH